jgi:cytochrome b6-f complex iron-sulfur subunit
MAETHKVVTKVWIAPGCIVCDSCENDCPEVFDVQEQTCVIRPPALSADFLKPLTPSVIVAAEGCPVDVIKFDTVEVEGPAPWAGQEVVAAGSAPAAGVAHAPAKAAAPMAPPDPRWQALLSTSRISPSQSAGLATTVRKSPEVIQAEDMVRAVDLPKDAPPDLRMAMLAVGGGYAPAPSMAERLRRAAGRAADAAKVTRRQVNVALVVGWGAIGFATMTSLAMFQDFFGPKVLKEPKKQWRVAKLEAFSMPNTVDESFKRTPDGGTGFWLVNLQPAENKLVAINTVCTHLGCIPNWLAGENKFKCPCHGSGYYMTGVNFEGPTPRPLERFAISVDPDGYVNVDQSKIYRSELGEWENPESFVML